MSATKTKVQSIIDENPVAVFSKSYCPYCREAKKLLSDSGAKFLAIELDQIGMLAICFVVVLGVVGAVDIHVFESEGGKGGREKAWVLGVMLMRYWCINVLMSDG